MKKTEVIQTVLDSALSEDNKMYWIQSYLLHWVTEDEVLEVIKTKGSC